MWINGGRAWQEEDPGIANDQQAGAWSLIEGSKDREWWEAVAVLQRQTWCMEPIITHVDPD